MSMTGTFGDGYDEKGWEEIWSSPPMYSLKSKYFRIAQYSSLMVCSLWMTKMSSLGTEISINYLHHVLNWSRNTSYTMRG